MRELVRLLVAQVRATLRTLLKPSLRRELGLARLRTIEEFRERARASLPKVIFDFVDGGSGDEVTLRRNVAAFDAWSIRPRFLVDVGNVRTEVSVLGRPVPSPLLGAPAGLLGLVHRDGEAALAAAVAQDCGSIYSLAAMSSYTIEEVRAAAPEGRLWFQTYLWRDREMVGGLLARAARAEYEALVVTVDVPRSSDRRRDRINKFGLPPTITARTLYEGVVHPRWSKDFLLHPRITAGNVADVAEGGTAVSIASYIDRQFDPTATWEDFAWLREQWQGPIVVKGLLDPADARRAVDLGAQAIAVSNHGGRQLDHAPASLEALAAIVEEVGSEAEIYIDGGVRRGSDVLKALALGANACLLGRPLIYGLAAAGREGAARALGALEDEVRAAMMLAGVRDVTGLSPHVLNRTVHSDALSTHP